MLDNVDEAIQIGGMLPSNPCFRLLVTTCIHGLDPTFAEELVEELTKDAAVDLLTKFLGDRVGRELLASQKLCDELLGNLPLGIELAGRYLYKNSHLTIAKFSSELSILQAALDAEDDVAVYASMVAKRGVKSVLRMSWLGLTVESQMVAKFLGLCAPKAVPWEVATKMAQSAIVAQTISTTTEYPNGIFQYVKNLGNLWKRKRKATAPIPEPIVGKTGNIEQTLQELKDLHLIKWDEASQTATLHALVRSFFREEAQTPTILTQIFADTMLQRARQVGHDLNLERVAAMRDMVPHIEEVATHYSHLLSEDNSIWPFVGAGRFYDSQGRYFAALPWYELCLEKAEQRLGANHPHTATSLNQLAVLYHSLGNYTAALPLCERALQIREEQLGGNHPDTATSLYNLAGLYHWLGNYTAALPLCERALQIREEQLGANHSDTATSLNQLAGLYHWLGNYTAALPLYERALQIREEKLGANHPDTANSLNDLALLYQLLGNYTAALSLFERAVQVREEQLGANHPHTATSLNNLAGLHRSSGNYPAALPLCERALQIREEQLGANHPDTANSLNDLALLYQLLGNYTAALPLYQRGLQIREEQLGANHSHTATSLNNLAGLYHWLGNYTAALPLHERALQIREEQLGANHRDTATSLNDLAELYRASGKYTAALPLYERALQIYEEQLGANHLHTAIILHNLALLYESMGNYTDPLPLYARAVEICDRVLGLGGFCLKVVII